MRNLAVAFAKEMTAIEDYINLIAAVIDLATNTRKGVRSKHPFVSSATKVQTAALGAGNFTITVYEGCYLVACAKFELAVRELIERYVQQASQRCRHYHCLPKEMRNRYPRGCAELILDIGQDKLKHLSVDSIVQGLAVCTRTASPSGFTLIEDAFSSNERNFRPEEVEKHLSYLGIDKVWQKLARENTMQTALGSANQSVVEQRARQTLTTAMQRRNDIVHRGKSYYTPSQSEVGDCTVFLSTLVVSLAEIMYKRLNTL